MRHPLLPVLLLILFPLRTFALDAQLFRPAPQTSLGTISYGTDVLPYQDFETYFFLHWTRNPLEFGLRGSNVRIDDLLKNVMMGNLGLYYGITNTFSLGLDLPVGFLTDVEPLSATSSSREFTFGDMEIRGSWQLIKRGNQNHKGWGLALVPYVTIPTGDEDRFIGNHSITGGFRLAWDLDLTENDYLYFNIGGRFRKPERVFNLSLNQEVLAGAGYRRSLWPSQSLMAFSEIYGSTNTANFLQEEITSPLELYVGLKKPWIQDRLLSQIGFSRGLNNGYGAPDIRIFGGVSYLFGPSHKQPPTQIVLLVKDETDAPIPSDITLKNTSSDQITEKASDTSRIASFIDPDRYEFRVFSEGYYPKKGFAQVLRAKTTYVTIILKKQFKTGKLENIGKVLFDLDRATIKEESHSALDEVASILNRYPEISMLQIEAHTDDLGSNQYNLDLSQRRAKAVVEYLISKGIDSSRLASVGFGETKPIAPNDTKEGRAKNRRTEFVILETAEEDLEVIEYEPSELYNIEKEESQKRY